MEPHFIGDWVQGPCGFGGREARTFDTCVQFENHKRLHAGYFEDKTLFIRMREEQGQQPPRLGDADRPLKSLAKRI